MALQQKSVDRCIDTIWAIAMSKDVGTYVIGYTSGPIWKRFHAYRANGFHHIVAIADGLLRMDALWLEEHIQTKIKTEWDKRGVPYRKYCPEKRALPYYPNSGPNNQDNSASTHKVYMAWRSDLNYYGYTDE